MLHASAEMDNIIDGVKGKYQTQEAQRIPDIKQ
jgi:hypothetical protein